MTPEVVVVKSNGLLLPAAKSPCTAVSLHWMKHAANTMREHEQDIEHRGVTLQGSSCVRAGVL